MALTLDREKALALRKQEMSYAQIKEILGVSKSTLSGWLKNFPLSKERIDALRGKNERRIERYRETRRKTKEARLMKFYLEEKDKISTFTDRDFFIAGLFLYWGEGGKTLSGNVSISNTDPSVINFFVDWVVNHLKVPKGKIRISLHLYSDMDIKKETNFWAKKLSMPKNQFTKPYIKKSLSTRINQKGGFGHGTCNARIGDARLNEKILMGIKVISGKYSNLGA
jgi:hypothetical protein